jgi:hypothetical protein
LSDKTVILSDKDTILILKLFIFSFLERLPHYTLLRGRIPAETLTIASFRIQPC